jgi:transposase
MDNLAAHKVKRVRPLIEATGARLVYLPPYSPDLSRIELVWSKVKAVLRKLAARTYEQLEAAIVEALGYDLHQRRHRLVPPLRLPCGFRIVCRNWPSRIETIRPPLENRS